MPPFDTTHVDAVLTNFSRQYALGSVRVAERIFPVKNVGKESGIYFRYNKGDQARVPYTKRALRSESRTVDWRVDTDSYKCEEYALNDLIDEREYQQADTPLDLQRDTVANLQRLMILDQEKRAHDLAMDGAVVTKNVTLTGTAQWRDAGASGSTSEPIQDFEAGSEAVRADTGLRPNLAVFGMEAWLNFAKNTQIINRIVTPGGNWGSPTIGVDHARTLLAPYGITDVVVPDMIENTAGMGVADSFSDLWGDEVGLFYVNPSAGLRSVTFGLTLRSRAWRVMRDSVGRQHSDWFEPSYVQDEKIVAADVGYIISDTGDGT